MTDATGFPDAVDANRSGRLSEQQLRELEAGVRHRSRGLVRHLLHSHDSFAQDVEGGRVESIEGAITKEIDRHTPYIDNESVPPDYRLSVSGRQAGSQVFSTTRELYESAPYGGHVRLYYLPRSRFAVNLELLPDAPVGDISLNSVKRVLADQFRARKAHDKVGSAEARAEMEAIAREAESYVPKDPPPGAQQLEGGEIAPAIIGDWKSPFLTLSVREGGTLTATMPNGAAQEGRWSVDPSGRLLADVMGSSRQIDAWIAGNELTLGIDGQKLKLKRV